MFGNGRGEEWKTGRVEDWKSGRLEEWKAGRVVRSSNFSLTHSSALPLRGDLFLKGKRDKQANLKVELRTAQSALCGNPSYFDFTTASLQILTAKSAENAKATEVASKSHGHSVGGSEGERFHKSWTLSVRLFAFFMRNPV
jgi:hypothetical protein